MWNLLTCPDADDIGWALLDAIDRLRHTLRRLRRAIRRS